jgi:methionyl-tRNA formyltransferase
MFIFASKDNYFSNKLFTKLKTKYLDFVYVSSNDDLTKNIEKFNKNIDKIFFFHWSYIIPKEIVNKYKCINIHTSNLPFGKGGSPIQNQIVENIISSKVNALLMNDKIDDGPIYTSRNITLQGNLFDIWIIIVELSYDIINEIIEKNIEPIEQKKIENEIIYKRRKNNIVPFEIENDIENIYNFIRMLDREDYPNPHIKIGNYILNFSRAYFNGKNILCDIKIEKNEDINISSSS